MLVNYRKKKAFSIVKIILSKVKKKKLVDFKKNLNNKIYTLLLFPRCYYNNNNLVDGCFFLKCKRETR